MSLTRRLTQTATIVSRSNTGVEDGYGNIVPAESEAEVACYLEQRRRDEDANQGEVSDADYLLVLPADTAIDTAAQVVVDGRVYEMVGEPWNAWNPRRAVYEHIECTVRRTVGAEDVS